MPNNEETSKEWLLNEDEKFSYHVSLIDYRIANLIHVTCPKCGHTLRDR
ncbi:MAG: hypothetical protein HWN66_17290, partial [Candidatus Helarchaeota archaeon]|nr:hypothetical protein [Candidatus Helarchaeota archaeon]